jgi:hypothetical protein
MRKDIGLFLAYPGRYYRQSLNSVRPFWRREPRRWKSPHSAVRFWDADEIDVIMMHYLSQYFAEIQGRKHLSDAVCQAISHHTSVGY